jgi:hypothetical protein
LRLNPPEDWQAFERLSRDLLAALFEDIHGDLNGRSGQKQDGVDVRLVDRRSGARVRVQCKDLQGAAHLDDTLIRGLVAEAIAAPQPTDRYVILTTAPNHAPNKALADELSRPGFEVQVHGWDWISAQVQAFPNLVERYGLALVIDRESRPPVSGVARLIGERLGQAITLMNEGRDERDILTLPSIAAHLGMDDWGRLEAIATGQVRAPLSELRELADGMGLCADWLIDGKYTPFRVDDPTCHTEVQELYEFLQQMQPEGIWFVREDGDEGDVTLVVERDALRWFVWTTDFPCSEHVGGTGQSQMLDLCALIRHLDLGPWPQRPRLSGRHISREMFWSLINGERHPRQFLKWTRNDDWWDDFSRLDLASVPAGDAPRLAQLRHAIEITRWRLQRARNNAAKPGRWRDFIKWGLFDRGEDADGALKD